MQTAVHTMPPPGRAQRRFWGFFFAILLQVGFVFALVEGLNIKVIHDRIVDPFNVTIPKATHPPPPPLPTGTLIEPKKIEAIEPKIIFDNGDGGGTAIDPNNRNTGYRPGPADHGPLGIAATHTTPPYPPLAIRLRQEGTVVLRLAISPQGAVMDAEVVRSSGYPGLDQAARAWVMGHWRYQPAIRGGAAVPAATTVGVEFNLRNAG